MNYAPAARFLLPAFAKFNSRHLTGAGEDQKDKNPIVEMLQDEQDEAFRKMGVPEHIVKKVRELQRMEAGTPESSSATVSVNEEESIQDILRKKGVSEDLIAQVKVTTVSGDRLSDIQDGKVEAPDFLAAAAADLPIHPDAVGKANIRMRVHGEGLDEIIDVPLKTK